MKACRDGFFRDICDSCVRQGWRIEKTGKNHWRFIPPDKASPMVIASGTPSDARARNNLTSQLRRSGLKEEDHGN